MDASDGERANAEDLEGLREAFPTEWREPPLGWEALTAWEAEAGVVLPEPYRSFIAEIANGSSLGPPEDGGLLPLGWLPEQWPHGTGPRNPSASFPLTEAWIWEEDDDAAGEHISAVYNDGSVVLGTEESGMYWLLTTTGDSPGSVWLVADVGAQPYPGPIASSFPDWVRRWQNGNGWWDGN
ncbi:SMI1/KNR4 family protein [Streptomyces sp. NPDC002812]|uniref:SMI1/KNR4 family protein n=1 Tax=Streptomyces sp. NPDC002812 TaxID=3154434 RepID=UPI00331ABBE5